MRINKRTKDGWLRERVVNVSSETCDKCKEKLWVAPDGKSVYCNTQLCGEGEENLKIKISQYYGVISVRLFDEGKQKNIAKLEVDDLMTYLQKKIDQKKYKIKEKGKGNILSVIELK